MSCMYDAEIRNIFMEMSDVIAYIMLFWEQMSPVWIIIVLFIHVVWGFYLNFLFIKKSALNVALILLWHVTVCVF